MDSIISKKIIVTGGDGNLSRHLRKFLPDATYINREVVDLLDYNKSFNIFNNGYDILIHTAAKVGNMFQNMQYPVEYFENNVIMNTNVIRLAHETNIKNVIAISSSCAYPDVSNTYPMPEEILHDSIPCITNLPYAYAKRAMAVHVQTYRTEYQHQWCVIYPCNLYSEYEGNHITSHFLNSFIYRVIETKFNNINNITLYGTGKPLRQFMYTDDLAKAIFLMVQNNIYEDFNVSPPQNIPIIEIARIALKACDAENINIILDMSKEDGQYRKDISNKKFLQRFPDFQFTSLFDGIKKVYQSLLVMRKNEKAI